MARDTLTAPAADADADAGTRRKLRLPRAALGLLLPVLALLAAEAGVRSGLIPANLLPAPSEIASTIASLAQQGLGGHVLASTVRVAIGFTGGALLAIVLGAAVGLNRTVEALLDPTFQALRAIPSLAWVPLLLLWLGIDEAPKLVLIGVGAFFPVYMGVASGIRDVDRKLIDAARMYRLSRPALARRVLLPAALPSIFTGLRNGLSLAGCAYRFATTARCSRSSGPSSPTPPPAAASGWSARSPAPTACTP